MSVFIKQDHCSVIPISKFYMSTQVSLLLFLVFIFLNLF